MTNKIKPQTEFCKEHDSEHLVGMCKKPKTHTPGPRIVVKSVDHHGQDGEDVVTLVVEDRSGKHPVRYTKTVPARLIVAAPDYDKLAHNIIGCVDDGKPWKECEYSDLLDCLESFTAQARAAIINKGGR